MYDTDARHPSAALEARLRAIYGLRRGDRLALGFRAAYRDLLRAMGDPHLRLPPVVHVAGTNGKGSTIAFMRCILESSGYKVHTYTSPHLVRFNERIRLAGRIIEDQALENLIDATLAANAGRDATFFEITTALAFRAFADTPADILLLETGLGGRLDCTNIVENPQATVITTISGDHREILGPTLCDIAAEKAGIMKPGRPCVIGVQTGSGNAEGIGGIFERKAQALDSPLFRSGAEWVIEGSPEGMRFTGAGRTCTLPRPGLPGPHQIGNAGAALAALEVIHKDFPVSPQAIHRGITHVEWPGRLQKVETGPLAAALPPGWELWLDGGHNDSAGAALAAQARAWQAQDGKPLHVIVGMMGSKHPAEFLSPLSPQSDSLTAVPIAGEPAALAPHTILAAACGFSGKCAAVAADPEQAVRTLIAPPAAPRGRILITGSLYLVGQILKAL